MHVLCVGEARVALVREEDGARFVARVDGAAARAALAGARHGAPVALAGGAGDDLWGRWLRARLEEAGVDLRWFAATGEPTALRFEAGDAGADYGVPAAAGDVRAAVEATGALLLAVPDARAHEHALRHGRPVVLLAGRDVAWRGLLDGAFLVLCDAAAARALSGEEDPARAAAGLLAGGVRHVLVAGEDGVLLRGADGLRARGRPRGDELPGLALGALATSGFYPAALAAALLP